ncbi:MAG: ABC transporter permease subunit [Bacillota bacterium]|nr:ABC transporter permease subunit [Bacillota bacterium]
MNIFIHELKSARKPTIIWICSMVAISLLFLSIYPGIYNDAETFKKTLASFPDAVKKALGLSIDNVTTLLGFYSFFFMYIMLCGAVQGMNLGLGILSKETRDKTADFLLTKPVSRKQIMTAKLMSALVSLIVTNIVFTAISFIIASAVKQASFSAKIFVMVSLTLFFIQLMLAALGIFISVAARKIRSVLPVSLATVFGFFVISMIGSILGDKAVRYITPFKYFDNAYIIKNASYETVFLVIEFIFIATAITASYIIYSRKDIHAV